MGHTPAVASFPIASFGETGRLALLDRLPELVIVLDGSACVRWANATTLAVLGYAAEELAGTSVFDHIHPDDVGYMLSSWEMRESHPGQPGLITQGRARTHDGEWRAFEVIGLSLMDDPDVAGMVVTARDLTHQSALADSPARMRSMVDRTTDVVLLIDGSGTLAYANRRLTALLGFDSDRVVGTPWASLVDPDDRELASEWLAGLVAAGDGATSRTRVLLTGPAAERLHVELHGTNQLADSLIGGVIVVARDVEELVAMQRALEERNERLAHAARHDPLTGLLNRSAFVGAVDEAIHRRREADPDGDVVVLFCDLDGFKQVNDDHGHEVGDAVLREVGSRLEGAVRTSDLPSRYGGDEFTVLLGEEVAPPAVAALVARIAATLSEPMSLGRLTVAIGVSIGVSRAPLVSADVDALLSAADMAMYERKRARTGGDRGPA